MTKFDHVKARFSGADLTFRIARSDLDTLEALGTPAFQLFRTITAGHWTVKQLRFVLAFALAPTGKFTKLATAGGDVAKSLAEMRVVDPRVDAAFAKNPPGDYVPLVQAVLAAALLGIDEADAHFTDEPDGP
ncbi:hypothetical protein [Devosia aquimaris]|uniref:hypothetical protein n=1 Tax=Devosia aquimaris TaxID=2866214 RepID=UPI001CD09DF5|nr:hypothetical protein [Devosia sp. CJK-A8-3]